MTMIFISPSPFLFRSRQQKASGESGQNNDGLVRLSIGLLWSRVLEIFAEA
jgi:hypothetical protein